MWNAHHRRILGSGPSGPEDHESAAELIDRGYATGSIRRSKGLDDYGKVIGLIWRGATLEGRELLRRLEAPPETTTNRPVTPVGPPTDEPKRDWSKSLPIQLALGVLVTVLGTALIYLIKTHAGVPL
jgi:hypothetical protein